MGISFWSQPPWPSYLQIGQPWLCLITSRVGPGEPSIELTASRLASADPQVGRSTAVEGWWVLGPLCSAWGFLLVEVFWSILGSCGHRKKLRRNKRTSEIFRWWLFQYGCLKKQLNNTLMEWKLIEVLGILTCWLWCIFFCYESWPSSFWLESIPDQQFALLISKDECVKNMKSHFANSFWNFRCVHSIFC